MSDEREESWPLPARPCQFVPDYALVKPDGTLFFLSDVAEPFALFVMPGPLNLAQTHLLHTLATKSREVRREITRLVVVTRPEHLFTVVSLDGDMLFLCDNSGDLVIHLAPEVPLLYLLDADRQIFNVVGTAGEFAGEYSPFVITSLRPAA